jgi:indole-3-pyruvate monooxygenase
MILKYDILFFFFRLTLALKLSTFAGCSWRPANDENAKKVVPEFEGLEEFGGDIFMHACDYKIQIQREL